MYQSLFKHDAAIRVAEQNRHPEALEMRQAHFQYLLDTNQEEQAAALKERLFINFHYLNDIVNNFYPLLKHLIENLILYKLLTCTSKLEFPQRLQNWSLNMIYDSLSRF
jgi:hypothetical protein